jgi:hypothetical protein
VEERECVHGHGALRDSLDEVTRYCIPHLAVIVQKGKSGLLPNQETHDRQRTMTRRTMWREDICRLCYIGPSPQAPCVSP